MGPKKETSDTLGSDDNMFVRELIVCAIYRLYYTEHAREYCRQVATRLYQKAADFSHRFVAVGGKLDHNKCPWPFGLVAIKEKIVDGEVDYDVYESYPDDNDLEPFRQRWQSPRDTDMGVIHTTLALFYEYCFGNMVNDQIITYKMEKMCPDSLDIRWLVNDEEASSAIQILKAFISYAEKDLQAKGLLGSVPQSIQRQPKRRKKTPPQFLKEARERQAVKELANNPKITCEQLGKILGCNKSTVTRLEAWQKKTVLDYDVSQAGFEQAKNNDRSNIEATE